MRGSWQTTDSSGGGLAIAVIAALGLIGSGTASAALHALEVNRRVEFSCTLVRVAS